MSLPLPLRPLGDDERLLHDALCAAPRRHALAPLGPQVASPEAAPEASIAFALETARQALHERQPVPAAAAALFRRALPALVAQALAEDPAFQAAVWRRTHPVVDEGLALGPQHHADLRRVRRLVDAWAHPARRPADDEHAARWHRLTTEGDWRGLQSALQVVPANHPAAAALQTLAADPALERLARGQSLADDPAVRHHRALLAQAGPAAGSSEAGAQGRASARVGEAAEVQALQAVQAVAAVLARLFPDAGRYRALQGLRLPSGFPGEPHGAKDEWDVALLRRRPGAQAEDLLMLLEVKASVSAVSADYPRLLRGLARLADASDAERRLSCRADTVLLTGESLARLRPLDGALPAHVAYACPTGATANGGALGAAARGALLADGGCIAIGQDMHAGRRPRPEDLDAVWTRVLASRPWTGVLHQHELARRARAAIVDPADLPPLVEARS